MKANFALNLSFQGIGVLHRAGAGWHLVGEIALDTDNLAGEMAELRTKAKALEPLGIKTKLLIPNEQIRYLELEAPTDGSDPEQAIRQALDGATPYAVDDLAYDWSQDSGTLLVAAVARETLSEAEDFAQEHNFNPLCFAAAPGDHRFAGEPFFGPTSHACNVLDDPGRVTREELPVSIVGHAHLPDLPDTSEDPVPAPDPAAEPVSEQTGQETGAPPDAGPEAEFLQQPNETGPDPERPASQDDTAESAAPAVTFASIRARRDDTEIGTQGPKLAGATRHALPDISQDDTGKAEVDTPQFSDVPDMPPGHVADTADATLLTAPEIQLDSGAAGPAVDETPPPVPAEPAGSGFVSRRTRTQPLPEPPHDGDADALDEKQRMTIFGAREQSRTGGKPRYMGLMLTVVLLIFLIGVAAWASIFLDDRLSRFFTGIDDTQVADAPEPVVEDATNAPAATDPEEAADELIIASLPQDAAEDSATQTPSLTPPKPAVLSPDEARARYAATGIWQMAPVAPQSPVSASADDIYQTSIDGGVTIQDAVALPDPLAALTDSRPATPASPAAPGTQYDLDERGLVRATPDGALSPDGIWVYAGNPPLLPPNIPDRPEAAILPSQADPSLPAVRPRLRPADLSEQNERGALSGRTRAELARLRPRLRPKSAQELAEETAAAALAASSETPRETTDPFAGATPQAVAVSLKPNTRPRNFERKVARVQETLQAEPVSARQRITPSIPTTASVAKAATERNALKLRRVNLIGVYGSANSRRALVRLSNGRYKKVKVGDRLDGGRVSAIGDDQLRYNKSGRSVVLRMPKG